MIFDSGDRHECAALTCVIMQPTYLPWAGYFNLLCSASSIVFLDDVQFEKQSWQQRNRILTSNGCLWLTVPVRRYSLSQTINSIEIEVKHEWRNKHIKSIEQAYSKHPYFKDLFKILEIIANPDIHSLSLLNIEIILSICNEIEIFTPITFSSNLLIEGTRSERLIKICKKLNCNIYLSPIGAKDYLVSDNLFKNSEVELVFQNYIPPVYRQKRQCSFISHISILDVIANIGWSQTKDYVRDSGNV